MSQRQPTPAQQQTTVKPPSYEPPMPRSLEDSGLNMGFLSDLVLKVMHFEGYLSGSQIADRVRLPFNGIVDQVLEFLKREQLTEVKGTGGIGEQAYQYVITFKGRDKAHEALD